jgi:predicted negative regulator of RcsB-dependent stress response
MNKSWNQIAVAVMVAIILGLLTYMGNWICQVYAEHRNTITIVHDHLAEYGTEQQQQQETRALIKQIARDIGDLKSMTMTVMGLAKVQSDGGEESSALVNINGRAMMYKSEARLRVTNMQSDEHQSIILKINGTFSMPDENKLLLLSKKAGAMIGLQPNQAVRVKLEPAPETE